MNDLLEDTTHSPKRQSQSVQGEPHVYRDASPLFTAREPQHEIEARIDHIDHMYTGTPTCGATSNIYGATCQGYFVWDVMYGGRPVNRGKTHTLVHWVKTCVSHHFQEMRLRRFQVNGFEKWMTCLLRFYYMALRHDG